MHGEMKGQTQKKGKDNGESLWKMALLGMTKLGVRSCVYTRDIYKSVRRRGRAVSCCTARVFSNSSSQCGDNKRETLHPDSRLQPPPLFFSKTSELVSTVKCFFPSLSRPCFSSTVSPPVRRNTDREKTTHGEKNLMANSEGE